MSPLWLFLFWTLWLAWLAVNEIGRLRYDRLKARFAAESAAQSSACVRARGLNQIGALNALLGVPVAGIGLPSFCWWPKPNRHPGFYFDVEDDFALRQKRRVESIQKIQEHLAMTYGGGLAWHAGVQAGRAYGARALPLDSFSLKLNRAEGPVRYWKTGHLSWVDMGGQKMILFPAGWVEGKGRWYIASEEFHRKRQRWMAIRGRAREIAAARPYSPKGRMFPLKDQPGTAATSEYLRAFRKGWEAQRIP